MLLCMPQGMERILQGCWWLVVLSPRLPLEAAGDGGRAHGREQVGGVLLVSPSAVYGPLILGPGLLVVPLEHSQRGVASLAPNPPGVWGEGWGW